MPSRFSFFLHFMASSQVKARIFQVGSFILGGILLYLSLRGVDFGAMLLALENARYGWLLPLTAIVLFSHVLRAWRWKILLDALEPEARHRRVPLKTAFYSVMIGYMVNYAAPRLGEVARSANVVRQSDHSFSSVIGTVVVERIMDVIVLVLAIISVVFLMSEQSGKMNALFYRPLADQLARVPLLWIVAAGVAGLLLLALLVVWARRPGSSLNRLWHDRIREIALSFKRGVWTVLHAHRPFALIASTVLIWFCYMLMAHLPFVILGMDAQFGLTLADSWVIMVLGAIGVTIPSPGGTGSYHYITIQSLVHLFAVPTNPAAAYAVLSHEAQLILYVAVGALSLFLQGASVRALRETAH